MGNHLVWRQESQILRAESALQHMLMTFLWLLFGTVFLFSIQGGWFLDSVEFCFAYIPIIYIYHGFQHLFLFREIALS
jgi:hypothetical protein